MELECLRFAPRQSAYYSGCPEVGESDVRLLGISLPAPHLLIALGERATTEFGAPNVVLSGALDGMVGVQSEE